MNKKKDLEEKSEMFTLIEKKGGVGAVIEILDTSEIVRVKENYNRIKEQLLSISPGKIDVSELKVILKQLLKENEVVFVTFLKKKNNGKVGRKKEYSKGFFYYIGENVKHLSKMYIHWDEEKEVLLGNISGLKEKSFLQL